MPAEDSAAPLKGDGAGFEDADRFVFGADPTRERWMGRPLAETRWWFELARLLTDPVLYGVDVPRGDGRPVVLMPGFLAGDQTLAVIAAWLRRVGYRPQLCAFVANAACSDHTLDRLERRLEGLWRRYGRRAALIGHSRGGHYARALAARRPDRVSHAISMGADLQGLLGASAPTRFAVGVARRVVHTTGRARRETCLTGRCGCSFSRGLRTAVPVRPNPADEHLFKGRRRRPQAMSADPACRLRRGDREPRRPHLQP
jgi:triacylglycerol lipase